jgi:hypothetical protein
MFWLYHVKYDLRRCLFFIFIFFTAKTLRRKGKAKIIILVCFKIKHARFIFRLFQADFFLAAKERLSQKILQI